MAKRLDLSKVQSALLGGLEAQFEGKPDEQWHAMLEHADSLERLVCMDWREEPAAMVSGLEKMLARLEVTHFDWSFFDHLVDMDQGEVLRNNNLLSHIRDQLAAVGLHLVHLNMQDDAFRFFIATPKDFDAIKGMGKKQLVDISDDFGADAYYELGRTHLAAIGFSQPAMDAKQSDLAQKKRKRRLQSIEKMLDDDAGMPPNVPMQDVPLVPEDSRFDVPEQVDQDISAWTVFLKIGWHVEWVFRRAEKRVRAGQAQWGRAFIDGFKLRLLQRLFLERAYLDELDAYPRMSDFLEAMSLYEAGRYLDLTHAAAAFHYLGHADEWRQCASLYRLFKRRLELPGKAEPEMEPMQLALISFLDTSNPGAADLDALSATSPFGPLFGTWHNDAYFSRGLDSLCEWHLASCHALVRSDDSSIHSAGMDFFPAWILAIDRHRERALGRSSLPQNDLIERAQPYIHAAFDGEEHAFVKRVRQLYERTYGNRPVDFAQEWERYMQESS